MKKFNKSSGCFFICLELNGWDRVTLKLPQALMASDFILWLFDHNFFSSTLQQQGRESLSYESILFWQNGWWSRANLLSKILILFMTIYTKWEGWTSEPTISSVLRPKFCCKVKGGDHHSFISDINVYLQIELTITNSFSFILNKVL